MEFRAQVTDSGVASSSVREGLRLEPLELLDAHAALLELVGALLTAL